MKTRKYIYKYEGKKLVSSILTILLDILFIKIYLNYINILYLNERTKIRSKNCNW